MVHLTEADIKYQVAHVRDDRSQDIIVSHGICIFLAAIAITMRFISRKLGKVRIGADDWMIVAAFVFELGEVIGGLICVHYGGGKHAILLKDTTAFAKAVLATEVLYNPAIACVKFSFLLFFRRVFPGRRFHALLWLVGTIVFIYSWIIIFSAIFQCQPIRATWDMSVKHAKCMKFNVEVVVFAVFNVITDVTILIIPIPILWKLQIPWSKKVQLMAVFLTGIFVCVVSAYRVPKEAFLSLADAPWSNVDPCVWSVVEVCVGIVSACLPTMRPLFLHFYHQRTKSKPTISWPGTSPNALPQGPQGADTTRMALKAAGGGGNEYVCYQNRRYWDEKPLPPAGSFADRRESEETGSWRSKSPREGV
ncbi:MAG: hypothetical protein LQ351_007109 [Letrouitia transgressa]|nr:MAG: hypothetical protein LQ351_007109 [Letrouitia transgressa]